MKQKKAFLEKLGKNVAKLRKQKGYSQDRIYLEAGLSRGTMSKIERGLVSVEVFTLYRVAQIIDVPLKKFFEF